MKCYPWFLYAKSETFLPQPCTADSPVISRAVHANLMGAARGSCIHLDRIRRILKLRPGGLVALHAQSRELGNKVRRADMELAMLTGKPTRFGRLPAPAVSRVTLSCDDRDGGSVPMPYPLSQYPLSQMCPTLQYSTLDILAVYRGASQATKFDPFQYQDIVASILQRLIDLAPLESGRPPELLDDVCQLGLLCFMTTILYNQFACG